MNGRTLDKICSALPRGPIEDHIISPRVPWKQLQYKCLLSLIAVSIEKLLLLFIYFLSNPS